MWTSLYQSNVSDISAERRCQHQDRHRIHHHHHLCSKRNLSNLSGHVDSRSPPFFQIFSKSDGIESMEREKKSKKKHSSRQVIDKGCLYQKSRRPSLVRNEFNQKELFGRYKYQKKAEREFYRLQNEVKQIQNLIATNPNLQAYYTVWLKQAKQALKEYSDIIESTDALSFSSVFGYSKDEELVTIYRHPLFTIELSKISATNSKQNLPNHYKQKQYFNFSNNANKPNADENQASFNVNQLNYYLHNYYEFYKNFNANNKKTRLRERSHDGTSNQ